MTIRLCVSFYLSAIESQKKPGLNRVKTCSDQILAKLVTQRVAAALFSSRHPKNFENETHFSKLNPFSGGKYTKFMTVSLFRGKFCDVISPKLEKLPDSNFASGMVILTDAKFDFSRLMVTLISGIRASEPPPPPPALRTTEKAGPDGVKSVIILFPVDIFQKFLLL